MRSLFPILTVVAAIIGVWYLAARPSRGKRTETRTYRVSNIGHLHIADDLFERPADFDLANWWANTSRRFETERFTGQARLRLSRAGLARACRWRITCRPPCAWPETLLEVRSSDWRPAGRGWRA